MTNELNRLPRRERVQRNPALAAAVAAVLALPSAAIAFEVDTGNENLSIRFDNTLRGNVSVRAESQDKAMLANPNFDDGNRNFDNGSVFTRLDLLSEFDLVWKGSLGFRVSAAGWWDPSYGSLDNKSLDTTNNLIHILTETDIIERYKVWGDVKTANQLAMTAYNYLKSLVSPLITYRLSVADLVGTVNVGGAVLNLSALSSFSHFGGGQYVIVNNNDVDAVSGTRRAL